MRARHHMALMLGLGVLLSGVEAQWREPGLEAVQAAVALTPDEEINIRVYRTASPGVVNITTTAVTYDFFLGDL